MLAKPNQVIRLLMVLIRSNRGKLRAVDRGALLVLLSTEFTPPIYTVAAAGPWCSKVAKKKLKKETVDRLSTFVSLCNCPYPEELCKFSDHFGPLHFAHSFQIDQDCQELEIARFLHRFSLIHAKITVLFKVRNKQQTQQQKVFRAPFSVRSLPPCSRLHPVLGETLPFLLSSEAVEAGLCGELSVATMAVLGPCMKQYPNWPTRISHIRFLVYCPSSVPLMRGECGVQLSFLQSLADSLPWGELGLPQVCWNQTHSAHDCPCCEVEFSIENDHSEEPQPGHSRAVSQEVKLEQSQPVEQTLTLFLFIQHNDPFNSQLSDLITNEEILETYLDKMLWYNEEKVRTALRSLLENALKEFLKRKKSTQTFQKFMPVILSSVNSIVSSSSSVRFRSTCLNSMKVENTHDLSISLHQTLHKVIKGRFTSRSGCTDKKAAQKTVSEQNSTETWEEELLGKRAHKDKDQSPAGSKRQCPESTVMDAEASTSSLGEVLSSPMTSLFCTLLSKELGEEKGLAGSSSGSGCTTEMNQVVEREWLRELENLTEWD